jgi:hypothetical protein
LNPQSLASKRLGFASYEQCSDYYTAAGYLQDGRDHGFETWSKPGRQCVGEHDQHDLLIHHHKGGSFSFLAPKILCFDEHQHPVIVVSIGKYCNHTVKIRVKPAVVHNEDYMPSNLPLCEVNAGKLKNDSKNLVTIQDYPGFESDLMAHLSPTKKPKSKPAVIRYVSELL